ncbi:MAG TPA: sensor domain-containing diguanylate cyclase [Pararhizobium sp.]|uniref:sensor domain-containing diguanylate cyclase n=1 Tax=Pararhizobium sp. TaxID=1977563 RepID=UPI002BDE42FD|nr:sensor domain-containing diguanylate cyclase [Pararhizobium sp.]HTO33970.1 sensor domain-containing diguanylate cyclase [Pararhizobium sp.]
MRHVAVDGKQTSARFEHLQELFDKSFKAARVGIWECSLPDQTLTWTDTVYELFDLAPQCALNRDDIVALYTPESRKKLTEVRSAAIRDGEGFTLDAEIVTAKGIPRWIRITAIVERLDGEPVRIFGMKQDITAEKAMFDHISRLTEIDALTGLASRARFETVYNQVCAETSGPPHALLLIDLDGFKAVNDTLGHQAGDECLKDAARRLVTALPEARLVARLGGDEFAVLHTCNFPAHLQQTGDRIVEAMECWVGSFPKKLKISASVGGAVIAGDAAAKDIFARADSALYAVKANGRNGFRPFNPERGAVSAA